MLERIDPKRLRSADALAPNAGSGRESDREAPGRERRRSRTRYDECLESPEKIDEMMARLSAAMSDIRRLSGDGRGTQAASEVAPDSGAVAAQIARDGAGALAAQAVLGVAGVRLVLDRGDAEAERK